MPLPLAADTAGHAVWWWILGIVAVIGLIWFWSSAAGSRSRVGAANAKPKDPTDDNSQG
ncbi:MAG TPA: hypothetical protein VNM16_13455 [Bacillota bacterium]|nr:hypothetical protein [Bacillota bacterium]